MSDRTYFLSDLWRYRGMVGTFTRHQIAARYRASVLGLGWALVTPLMMLLVYTFFFNTIFGLRWPNTGKAPTDFALVLFLGLCVFSFFADAISRAATSIHAQPNFVTKIRFPLEMMAVIDVAASAFHLVISLVLWCIAYLVIHGALPWEIAIVPIALIPFVIFTLALSWLLAAVGVYYRDTQQVVAALIPALLFLSPVFYPITLLPDALEAVMQFSPIAVAIELTRGAVYADALLPLTTWATQLTFALLAAFVSLKVFRRLRPGFADVV